MWLVIMLYLKIILTFLSHDCSGGAVDRGLLSHHDFRHMWAVTDSAKKKDWCLRATPDEFKSNYLSDRINIQVLVDS